MPRKMELVLADWPQPCAGNCGRLLRPPKMKAADFPDVQTWASQRVLEPWCQVCRALATGKKPGHHKTDDYIEREEARLERIRQELRAMVADRRRRGVPEEGVVLPGEERQHLRLQRVMPGDAPTARPRTPKIEETFSDEAPLGTCQKGHPFTGYDPVGRRKCDTCAQIRIDNNRRRHLENGAAPSEKGHCKRGHPYTHVSGSRKYCPVCKGESRKRCAMAKAMRKHASARIS